MEHYYLYILTNTTRTTTYVGVTNQIERRLREHRENHSTFTARYKLYLLVHLEEYADIREAIAREKQIKSWSRARKFSLIDTHNPLWVNRL